MSTKIGALKHGLKVGDVAHKSFEIREATAGDLFTAETFAGTDRPIAFAAALLCQQLLSIGTFTGPFTLEVIGKLKRADLNLLQEARLALDEEGEAEQLE